MKDTIFTLVIIFSLFVGFNVSAVSADIIFYISINIIASLNMLVVCDFHNMF